MTHLVWDLFDGSNPEDNPVPPPSLTPDEPVVEESEVEVEEDTYDSTRPRCSACGDPNYSLANDRCIGCRALLCPSPRLNIY